MDSGTVGLVVGFAVFHGLASLLGSDRGQWGLVVVGGVVVLTTLVVQRVLFAQPPLAAIRWLGITRTTGRGLAAGLTVGALLLLVIPAFAAVAGGPWPRSHSRPPPRHPWRTSTSSGAAVSGRRHWCIS